MEKKFGKFEMKIEFKSEKNRFTSKQNENRKKKNFSWKSESFLSDFDTYYMNRVKKKRVCFSSQNREWKKEFDDFLISFIIIIIIRLEIKSIRILIFFLYQSINRIYNKLFAQVCLLFCLFAAQHNQLVFFSRINFVGLCFLSL